MTDEGHSFAGGTEVPLLTAEFFRSNESTCLWLMRTRPNVVEIISRRAGVNTVLDLVSQNLESIWNFFSLQGYVRRKKRFQPLIGLEFPGGWTVMTPLPIIEQGPVLFIQWSGVRYLLMDSLFWSSKRKLTGTVNLIVRTVDDIIMGQYPVDFNLIVIEFWWAYQPTGKPRCSLMSLLWRNISLPIYSAHQLDNQGEFN